MPKKQSPILDFKKATKPTKSLADFEYDIKIGGRINATGRMQIESESFPYYGYATTLITETREAVDSSENS